MALFEAMDYKGQQLCEYLYSFIIILFGIIAWFVGYSQGDFFLSFKGWAAGLAIALVLCIPDWPFYNRNKVTWQDEAKALIKDISKQQQANKAAVKPKKKEKAAKSS